MEIHGFAAGPFKTNCYVWVGDGPEGERHCVVIDPGMHAHDKLVQLVADQGLTVDKIVLTHGHVDHTRDAAQLAKRWGIDIYIHALDAPMLEDPSIAVSSQTSLLFDVVNMTPYPNSLPLEEGQVLDFAGHEFRVVHAPGHSPGSVLLVGDGSPAFQSRGYGGHTQGASLVFGGPSACASRPWSGHNNAC